MNGLPPFWIVAIPLGPDTWEAATDQFGEPLLFMKAKAAADYAKELLTRGDSFEPSYTKAEAVEYRPWAAVKP